MQVGFINSGIADTIVKTQLGDSPSIDAFSRLRVSQQGNVFDNQFTYDLAPLVFEQVTSGSGATINYNSTNRIAISTFSSTPASGLAFLQTYQYFRYQPSKSQIVYITFNMLGGTADVLKFAGYSDGVNGIEFQLSGSLAQFAILSATALGNQVVGQSSWNLDTLDGSADGDNPSGISLDLSKVQILVLDFQALYAGRVRVGFDIGGSIIYAHEFLHSNSVTTTYLQSANLPIRVGMKVDSGASVPVSSDMAFLCCAVATEGGQDDDIGYAFCAEGTATASSGADTHILSIQPRTTFGGITNRAKIVLNSVDIINTGNNPIIYKVCIGQAFTGSSTTNVNSTYSVMDSLSGTLSGVPAIVFAQGYADGSNKVSQGISKQLAEKYPITLTQSGAVRNLGRITVLVNGIGGTSTSRAVLNWTEIR